MKIIKYIFFLLLLIIIGGAVYIATLDGNYEVKDSRIIDAPNELLFKTVNDLKTWEKWGPWMDDSDDMNIKYTDQTVGEGAAFNWTSEIQGDGKIKTVKAIPFKEIKQEITFYPPMVGETTSDVFWEFEKLEEGRTKVTWGIKGEQGFMEKMFWATQDSSLSASIKPMYTEGLEKLDDLVNTQMKEYSITVEGVTEHGGGFYMYTATASAISAIPDKMKQMVPTVKSFIQNNNLPQTGMPFTLFNEYNDELGTAIYSVGIPVRERVITPVDSNVLCDFLPRQKAVKVVLKGNYDNLEEAWQEANKYVAQQDVERMEGASPFEVYKVTGDLQPNPAEWITEIYIPIK